MASEITGIVLAGGKSSRMGRPKALLPYKGTTLIEYIVGRLKPYCANVILSVNEPAIYKYLKIPLVVDKTKNLGPLGGLEAAIAVSPTEYSFIVPCDLPFFSGAIVPFLRAQIQNYDASVPIVNGFYEPLVAVYAKSALMGIRRSLADEKLKVKDAFEFMNIKTVSEEELKTRKLLKTFYNINTFLDYEKVIGVTSNGWEKTENSQKK